MRPEPCPSGTLCRAGVCAAPCDGVVCPSGRICAGGACIDPCAGVVCPTNQVCIADEPGALTLCGPACTCTELAAPLCPPGEACHADVLLDLANAGACPYCASPAPAERGVIDEGDGPAYCDNDWHDTDGRSALPEVA